MDFEYYYFLLAFFGGLFAGCLNTLAGNGSAITLTILSEIIGLPANIANGTNRIGVFSQGIASALGFMKYFTLNKKRDKIPIVLCLLGAINGFVLAIIIPNDKFLIVFKYLMILLFVSILFNPKKWLHEQAQKPTIPMWLIYILFFVVGFYGGFIQMGMGVIFLLITVLGAKYTLMEANFLKTIIIPLYTLAGIIMFSYHGLIHWEIGIIMAIGQAIGGYYTAKNAAGSEKARFWAYRLLVVAMILALIKLFIL